MQMERKDGWRMDLKTSIDKKTQWIVAHVVFSNTPFVSLVISSFESIALAALSLYCHIFPAHLLHNVTSLNQPTAFLLLSLHLSIFSFSVSWFTPCLCLFMCPATPSAAPGSDIWCSPLYYCHPLTQLSVGITDTHNNAQSSSCCSEAAGSATRQRKMLGIRFKPIQYLSKYERWQQTSGPIRC